MQPLVVSIALAGLSSCIAVNNGLALTPAMGYNTWDDFRCDDINEQNVIAVAKAMVSQGFLEAGYTYLNIDDCWATSRDPESFRLVPDPVAFPNGMKAVADAVHDLGLKFGIYTDRGTHTCEKRPGSQGFEGVDASTFASWGVDYVKEDSCYSTQVPEAALQEYSTMRDALNNTGRPIYFSLCGWHHWYAQNGSTIGNSWRISGDVNHLGDVWLASQSNNELAQYAGPGGWNDPDMLLGSNPKTAAFLLPEQSRTQFSLWAVMAAPLIVGSMIDMSDYDLETFLNADVIAIDQDPLGKQGTIIQNNCPPSKSTRVPGSCQQIWAKPLESHAWAVIFVNWDPHEEATITCGSACFSKMGFSASHQATATNIWAKQDLGVVDSLKANVASNATSVLFRVSPL